MCVLQSTSLTESHPGRPGCGKTVLAATAIDNMKTSPLSLRGGRHPETVYYFFRFDSPHNNTTAALRAVMAQLLQMNRSNRTLLDACIFTMQYSSHGQSTATAGELRDLILAHMHNSATATHIVLDGIDEASDVPDTTKTLQSLAEARTCRILLFSRPAVEVLQRAVPEGMRLGINKAAVAADIRLYLRLEIDELASSGLLPAHADSAMLADQLTAGADGMFLWARLMIAYVSSPIFDASRRLEIIRDDKLPEGLDAMYDRICDTILKRNTGERHLASRVLVWLTYSLTHLDTAQLREISRSAHDNSVQQYLDPKAEEARRAYEIFEETVLWACAGLVDKFQDSLLLPQASGQRQPHGGGFRFIHLSAKEYFSTDPGIDPWSRGRSGPGSAAIRRGLVPNPAVAHIELATMCLRYLIYYAPAQPISGDVTRATDPHVFRQGFPFASYAAPFWIRHLGEFLSAQSASSERLEPDRGRHHHGAHLQPIADLLSSFLAKPLTIMSWIEAHYLSMNLVSAGAPCSAGAVLDLCPKSGILSELAQLFGEHGYGSRDDIFGDGWGGTRPNSRYADLGSNLYEFERDMQDLQTNWSTNLQHNPEIIWDEVPAFRSSSRFLLRTAATKVTSLAPDTLDLPNTSTHPLCVISNADSNCKLMAVLSVWPSRCELIYPSITALNKHRDETEVIK